MKAPPQLNCSQEKDRLPVGEAICPRYLEVEAGKALHTTEQVDQSFGRAIGVPALLIEEDRDQLGIGQRARSPLEEARPWITRRFGGGGVQKVKHNRA